MVFINSKFSIMCFVQIYIFYCVDILNVILLKLMNNSNHKIIFHAIFNTYQILHLFNDVQCMFDNVKKVKI